MIAFVLLASVPISLAACPNLPGMRSSNVAGGAFRPADLVGLWYEAAYMDVAQVGASCPTINVTLDPATMVVSMALTVSHPVSSESRLGLVGVSSGHRGG